MAQPGLVMRLAQLRPGAAASDSPLEDPKAVPNAEAVYQCRCNDDKEPGYNTIYFIPDVTPIINDNSLYEADVSKHSGDFASLAWVVVSFVNGRDPGAIVSPKEPQTPSSPPPLGTVIVANGSTPRPEWAEDYHAWYDQEHGGKLGKVPGWQLMRRYKFEKLYGDAETAGFYGINFYDEANGLGGPEWKEGVTEWTMRIREHAAKPNIRRVWKLAKVI